MVVAGMAAVDGLEDVTGDGGVFKRTLRAGYGDVPPADDSSPVMVVLGYEGRLLSGQVFDSSSERDAPARFLLGRGHVIRGWDAAVRTMHAGELAEVTVRADYAYGVTGQPPAIPPHATLVYTVELLAFEELDGAAGGGDGAACDGAEDSRTIEKVDKLGPAVLNTDGSARASPVGRSMNTVRALRAVKDITCDGGVLKRTFRLGSGDVPPAATDSPVRVTLGYEGRLLSGEVFDSSSGRDSPAVFLLGRGHVIRGWDAAVRTMSAGERAELTVRADYAYGPAGRPPAIPPHATLVYTVELFDFEELDARENEVDLEEEAAPAWPLGLPGPGQAACDGVEGVLTAIELGRVPIKVDKLGPVRSKWTSSAPIKVDKLGWSITPLGQ